jgi:hypothetical protein
MPKEITLFELKNIVYKPNTPEVRFILSIPVHSCLEAIAFGDRIYQEAFNRIKNTFISIDDIWGFLMGFHCKTLDQLVAVRALSMEGCLGAAISAARTIVELNLQYSYILEDDTDARIAQFEAYASSRIVKYLDHLIALGDSSSRTQEAKQKFEAHQRKQGRKVSQGAPQKPKDLATLAKHLHMERLYAHTYRLSSMVVHANDIHGYNPLICMAISQDTSQLTQPHFVCNSGYWAVSDVIEIAFIARNVSWALFGQTADHLGIPLTADERSAYIYSCHAINDETFQAEESYDSLIKKLIQ